MIYKSDEIAYVAFPDIYVIINPNSQQHAEMEFETLHM